MIRFIAATASLAVLAACASPTVPLPEDSSADTEEATVVIAEKSQFELAMETANGLVEAGNSQTAIDRLTQLLGDPDLTVTEKAETVFRRGEIRYSETGYNVWGAIEDFEEVMTLVPDTELAERVRPMLDMARGEATSLNFALETQTLTRNDRFNHHFRLGEHAEAVDLMQANNLTPDNAHLLAMYQIGYLCEGDELAGPAYATTEPDGTSRSLQFCDSGK